MLNSLTLRYFKCFESLDLPLAPLTLLSGTNASGKSSVLQALVLLHQTMQEHESSTRLMLNGKYIKLGTVQDVVNEQHGVKSFEIGFEYNKHSYLWSFTGGRQELSLDVKKLCIDNKEIDFDKVKEEYPELSSSYLSRLLPTFYAKMSQGADPKFAVPASAKKYKGPFFSTDIDRALTKGLTYISAERIGPRETYPLEDKQIASVVGATGEHTISIFYLEKESPILEELLLKSESRNTLFHQVRARMRLFFPGFELEVVPVLNANAVTLGLRNSNAENFRRPINTGFGLTQILPIVIAALSAQKEDILLIENPEVHLHPAGQALMGQFLAEVASAGVQVILETHSDHVLNGIRLAVNKEILEPEKTCFHYFQRNQEGKSIVTTPKINKKGRMDDWPDGFFDEWDKALFELV